MQRISRRVFLTVGATGLSLAACSGPTRFDLRRPTRTGEVPLPGRSPTAAPATTEVLVGQPADGYVVIAPKVLHTGQTEPISFSLFRGDQPSSGPVTISLERNGQVAASSSASIRGHGTVALPVPNLAAGQYDLKVHAAGFEDQTTIQVEGGTLVFLESDKPIYKPGQTIHFRLLALAPSLLPAAGDATLEVMDARGIKVFRTVVQIGDLGMATVDLPLSAEPNLGVWKATATVGKRTAQLDVRVEEYVLPKYEVKVDLARDWALVSDPIKGSVEATYSYGKPVAGEVEISALRYVGTWQPYAQVKRSLRGKLDFEIPPVRYAAGSPASGGMSNVRLDVTVREQSTGYEEHTSQLVTIAAAPITLRIIPESTTFKPSLPMSLLVVAETPDKKPVDVTIQLDLSYQGSSFQQLKTETRNLQTKSGLAMLKVTPPDAAAMLSVTASARDASTAIATVRAGYSPSGSFIHVEQATQGTLKVGDTAHFTVASNRAASSFYYEVVARGQVAFSAFSPTSDISITLTPSMAPEARLLVYQILPNGEIAADYLPFKVEGDYPQNVALSVDQPEVKPGDALNVAVQTEGPARVGLVAVDKSVFILAENRLNLQQVFDALERLYLKPQVELHEAQLISPFGEITLPGAKAIFDNAGVVVLTNRQVPDNKQLQPVRMVLNAVAGLAPAMKAAAMPTMTHAAAEAARDTANQSTSDAGLAEVQRVRQYFPETWIWDDFSTDATGRATRQVTAPDSITTWMLRAVALSKDKGLGIGEAQVRVFQPFFVTVDLPYSAIRGEELPVRVALYNYQPTAQQFVVDLEPAGWFDLIDAKSKTVAVEPNGVGSASFTIRPRALGTASLKVTARGQTSADAIVRDLLVEPEGVPRELVENVVLSPGAARTLDLAVPASAVSGSPRAFVTLTGNILSQTIQGLDGLLQMPFGCGEQNMINFAPDVFISRYLKATNQLKTEVMAKAELLMLTGYQRELTYRRSDGSFSAFGENDPQGSLFLTAFVLKTFAQARDLIYVDDAVLSAARTWILQRQNVDGSFDPFGFLHHQDLLGGIKGKISLTAYVALALHEAGEDTAAARAIQFLEGTVDQIGDAYSLATTAYALALAKSGQAQAAHDRLMRMAHRTDNGLWWGDEVRPLPVEPSPPVAIPEAPPFPAGVAAPPPPIVPAPLPTPIHSAAIETTGYAALALLAFGDKENASQAIRWLVGQRNARGGFGSTQDTVVALQALTTSAISSRFDTDATVSLRAGAWTKNARITADNADVLQIVEVPVGQAVTIEARGKGDVLAQAVRRYNLPDAEPAERSAFQIDVSYGTDRVDVNDLITVTARIKFTPPEPLAAGMVVLDVAVPTGFEPVGETLAAAVKALPKLKRWDLAGRKVILYLDDMQPGEQLTITFQARALYPVRAQAVRSQVYAYYRPDWKGESLGGAIVVGAGATGAEA